MTSEEKEKRVPFNNQQIKTDVHFPQHIHKV